MCDENEKAFLCIKSKELCPCCCQNSVLDEIVRLVCECHIKHTHRSDGSAVMALVVDWQGRPSHCSLHLEIRERGCHTGHLQLIELISYLCKSNVNNRYSPCAGVLWLVKVCVGAERLMNCCLCTEYNCVHASFILRPSNLFYFLESIHACRSLGVQLLLFIQVIICISWNLIRTIAIS